MRLVPLENSPNDGKDFVNEHRLELGHILPPTEKTFKEHFPLDHSFLLRSGKRVSGLFSYRTGRDKQTPTAAFRALADSAAALKRLVAEVEAAAVAGEKIIVRTSVFGYDSKKLQALKALGYKTGASLPGTVSLRGKRYDYHILYKNLTNRYGFTVARSYAKPGLYPAIEVARVKDAKLRVRGYHREDRPILDKFAAHEMVIRGIGSGIFGGLYPWVPGDYDQFVESGRTIPIVCEDEATGEPVGLLDLFRSPFEVMQHSTGLGMFVRPEYQGIGVGTMLMNAMKTLARRLHLARVWLSVFEGNVPAQRLYQKTGFEECGKVPGWLQEGYINEIFMVLKLD